MVFVCDPLGDMLTRIRNAQMRLKADVLVPFSHARGRVLHVLQAEGYILGYSVSKTEENVPFFSVQLKYHNNRPVIRSIQRVSRPGRRVYASASDIPRVANGLGVTIVSTSHGVLSDASAREKNVGGEVLCQVF